MTITTADPTCMVVFDEPTEWVDRGLQTASWWDRYEILPGAYPLEWVTINYTPAPEGSRPYYATARIRARLLEEYRVNRLLWAESAERRAHTEPRETVISATVYAYTVPGCPDGQHGRPLETLHGGRVVPYVKES